jgi:anti-anti-sigma regulatory factor
MSSPSDLRQPLPGSRLRCIERPPRVLPPVTAPTVAALGGTAPGRVIEHHEPPAAGPFRRHGLTVVGVTGDVDGPVVGLLERALTRAVDRSPAVCCDLTRATFFGAAGVNTLFLAHRYAVAARRHFGIRGARGLTWQVCTITGLDRVIDFRD